VVAQPFLVERADADGRALDGPAEGGEPAQDVLVDGVLERRFRLEGPGFPRRLWNCGVSSMAAATRFNVLSIAQIRPASRLP